MWTEAGCPSAGGLSTIKRHAKKRYKYEVRRLKRTRLFTLRTRVARSFAMKRKDNFWSDIRRLNSSGPSSASPVVDGICGNSNIANLCKKNRRKAW